ncbi:MAG: hypothetical protein ACREUF_16625, partial [Solimonas sp.]
MSGPGAGRRPLCRLLLLAPLLLLLACGRSGEAASAAIPAVAASYDPLAFARADRQRGLRHNPEPTVPPQCYTRTAGESNPCWTCHTRRNGGNLMEDAALQEEYAFSAAANDNHWR